MFRPPSPIPPWVHLCALWGGTILSHILSEGELLLLCIISGPVNIQFEVCMIHTGPEAGEGLSVEIQ